MNHVTVKSILNKTKQTDSWFLDDYTINAYSGCSFNCLYCYIRGSKYGLNMADKVSVKANALEILDKQLYLRGKKKQYGFIVMSSATDPWLQFEKTEKITRGMLELILKHKFPLHVITKSDLIIRDFDLLKQIQEKAIVPPKLQHRITKGLLISFSYTTLDDAVSKIFEPGATPPSVRLETAKACIKNGFYTGISMMPLLPFISDTKEHLNLLFKTFKEAGMRYLLPATITLFGDDRADSKTLVFRAVEKHYPHLFQKYKQYFEKNTGVPPFYYTAFTKKMKEMSSEYNMPLMIDQVRDKFYINLNTNAMQ